MKILKTLLLLVVLAGCQTPGIMQKPRNSEIWGAAEKFPDGNVWGVSDKKIQFNVYNDILKDFKGNTAFLIYDIEDQAVGISFVDFIHSNRIFLNDESRLQLISLLDKYLEWEQTAVENKDKLDKVLGTVPSKAYWNVKNREMYTSYSQSLTVTFFSQNPSRHQVVISFPQYKSVRNQYITHSPETMYLEKKSAVQLRDLLKNDSVQAAVNQLVLEQKKEQEKYK